MGRGLQVLDRQVEAAFAAVVGNSRRSLREDEMEATGNELSGAQTPESSRAIPGTLQGPGGLLTVEDIRACLRQMEDGLLVQLRRGELAAQIVLGAKMCQMFGSQTDKEMFGAAPNAYRTVFSQYELDLFLTAERPEALQIKL